MTRLVSQILVWVFCRDFFLKKERNRKHLPTHVLDNCLVFWKMFCVEIMDKRGSIEKGKVIKNNVEEQNTLRQLCLTLGILLFF